MSFTKSLAEAGSTTPAITISSECVGQAGLWERQMSIWMILFVVLLIAWIGGFTVFHVAGALIHLLLILAVVSLVVHFLAGRSAV